MPRSSRRRSTNGHPGLSKNAQAMSAIKEVFARNDFNRVRRRAQGRVRPKLVHHRPDASEHGKVHLASMSGQAITPRDQGPAP